MNTITVRNIEDDLKLRLRVRAAERGHSMEEEVRSILRSALHREESPAKGLGTAIHELFKPFGGVELDIPRREPMRELPRFDG